MIDRRVYSDDRLFHVELERLFYPRQFVGVASDFVEEDSYRSFRLGKHAVTARRDGEHIRVLNNVCLHRNALIDPSGSGSKPFRCGYHGWSYGKDGVLLKAPLADTTRIAHCALTSFPVAQAGELAFCGLGGVLPEVDELRPLLDKQNLFFGKPFHEASIDHACNWKLLVENVLEGYHLSFIHPDSFPVLGFPSTSQHEWGTGLYTSWSLFKPPEGRDRSANYQRLSSQFGHFYFHIYAFPGLFLASTNGMIGYVGQVVPVDACHSRLVYQQFELPGLRALPESVRQPIRKEAIEFGHKVLEEDRIILESCQQGLESEGTDYQLQAS